MTKLFVEPDDAESRNRYELLTGLVMRRPIGWMGTRHDGTNNLASRRPTHWTAPESTTMSCELWVGSTYIDTRARFDFERSD